MILFIKRSKTIIDEQIWSMYLKTKDFVKNNQDVLFTHADKSEVIAIDKVEYMSKMETMLEDTDTYTRVTKSD